MGTDAGSKNTKKAIFTKLFLLTLVLNTKRKLAHLVYNKVQSVYL